MNLRFTKMQGVGNDFIVVDGREVPGVDWAAAAPRLCDRRSGIGADGILLIEEAQGAEAAMRMFNPDGTEDFCGNGLRCVARYVAERFSALRTFLTIATIAGPRAAELHPDRTVTVEMGQPRFDAASIPVVASAVPASVCGPLRTYSLEIGEETLNVSPLSTGTTHSIVFVDALPDDERFFRLSPKIERHPLFPERTSVMWTTIEGAGRLRLRIWERGAEETWGCGSGACAAAVAANLLGHTGDETVVASKGGALGIRWDGGGPIRMSGPAEYVFEGVIPL